MGDFVNLFGSFALVPLTLGLVCLTHAIPFYKKNLACMVY